MGDHTTSQRDAAEHAGLSKHQQVQAVRVANVPEDQFQEAVEGDTKTTITKLANTHPMGNIQNETPA